MKRVQPSSKESRLAKKKKLARVLECLIAGMPYGQIVEDCAIEFDCSPRTIKEYITQCRNKVIPNWYSFADQRVLASEAIAKAESLFWKAKNGNQLSVALGCLKWIGELQGLTVAQMVAESAVSQPGYAASISLDTFNAARRIYGMPEWAPEKWDEFHRRDGSGKGN